MIDGFEHGTVQDPRLRGNLAAFSWYSFGVQITDGLTTGDSTALASFVAEHDLVNPRLLLHDSLHPRPGGAHIHRDDMLASGNEQRSLGVPREVLQDS